MESHLTIEMSQLLTLMESAALGGAQSEAAAATASDGSPPMATNPNAIPFVEYKNYHKTVKQYKVAVHNWPMKTSGQMMDPNTMGLGQLQLLL
ncbi:hypothetical protein FRC12_023254 [Ceratobasidium sp. 428]|nr:hypothetical protein FRC12_023254 [Ceratobasidium sp. 428]